MLLAISKYDGKTVRIYFQDGEVLEGFVRCYLPAEENEGKEAIVLSVTEAAESSLSQPGDEIEIGSSEIASIEALS